MDAVLYELSDGIATITLNRPEQRNAVNLELCRAMTKALDEFEQDPAARVAVLTGAGRAFCAGADIAAFAAGDGPALGAYQPGGFAGYVRYPRAKPVIAAVNGHAFGGGLELVLASDLAIASRDARFGTPEVKLGLMAGAGGAIRLPQQLPVKAALRLLLTGEPIDAEEACRLGLINAVTDPGAVLAEAHALAGTIRDNAPLAVQATLRVARAAEAPEDAAWAVNFEVLNSLFATADAAEGQRAFFAKRAPVWSGS